MSFSADHRCEKSHGQRSGLYDWCSNVVHPSVINLFSVEVAVCGPSQFRHCLASTLVNNRSDRFALIAALNRSRVTPTPSATKTQITPRSYSLVANMTQMQMK
ncbi:hypothetical protein AVEN_151362-1 [Araneus ventricosus]|uniref:Uncharacterized protein n=1 Tax=Araneus ventricosus TaxID=182803 RepID=A0A4Y2C9A3_ARAVE|nr:hypothetical protein AVEN_151362-1 [Araneus ventricosus]